MRHKSEIPDIINTKYKLKTRRNLCEYVYRKYWQQYRNQYSHPVSSSWLVERQAFERKYKIDVPEIIQLTSKQLKLVEDAITYRLVDVERVEISNGRTSEEGCYLFVNTIKQQSDPPLTEQGLDLLHKGTLYYFIKHDWRYGIAKSVWRMLIDLVGIVFLIMIINKLNLFERLLTLMSFN